MIYKQLVLLFVTLSVVDSFAPPAAVADEGAEAELASVAAAAPPLSVPDIVTKSTSHTALMHCSNHYELLCSPHQGFNVRHRS